jgi:hypothetical protein
VFALARSYGLIGDPPDGDTTPNHATDPLLPNVPTVPNVPNVPGADDAAPWDTAEADRLDDAAHAAWLAAGSRTAEPWASLLRAVDEAVVAQDLVVLRAAADRIIEESLAEHDDEEVPL